LGGKIFPDKLANEQPLRAELFSLEQFKIHAKFLAEQHTISLKRGSEKLLSRLKENGKILRQAYELLNTAVAAKRGISPAGEWLLDNYYLIEEQIRLARKFLPKGYSRELPELASGLLAGYPRVYDIAREMVSHGDGMLDIGGLAGFVDAYQGSKHLNLGELWAIPIMLRLALIENLRRVSSHIIFLQRDRDIASLWAGRILKVSDKDTADMVREVAAMSNANLPMTDAFVSEFVRQLHGISSNLNLPLIWLEKKLYEQGDTIERLILMSGQKLASNQVSVANTIGSLRLIESTNWHDFVEGSSTAEAVLKDDPSGDYALMSFETRDEYRHVIERLALQAKLGEAETASHAVRLANDAAMLKGKDHVTAHVGYYILDNGLEQLYRSLGIRFPVSAYLNAKKTQLFLFLYLGSITVITAGLAAGALLLAVRLGAAGRAMLAFVCIAVVFAASQTALALVNWLATAVIKPSFMPRMDFSGGIPAGAHTLVVTPALLADPGGAASLIEDMEVNYLANAGANADFGLLTDFVDANREKMDGDAALLEQVRTGVEELNRKYSKRKDGTFYLFHRERKWNAHEGVWMGYERKRGKLSDLNALLRGKGASRFSAVVGDPVLLQGVKYVLTIDEDIRLPRGATSGLAAVMSHPLNRPIYDEKKKRVVAGYGILQPRVEAGYPGEDASLFVKIFGGETGIDPYTRSVSDVYQDLFHEGSFIGKGIYDVDAFERSLKGVLPENLILSHDMLEGCYARCGLVTDIQIYEKFPTGYLKDVSRRRRWMRGDWQIAGWLMPLVRDSGGNNVKNPLSFLSKWKILDNLRRSFTAPSTVLLFLWGWATFRSPWPWTLLTAAFSGLPVMLLSMAGILKKQKGAALRAHLHRSVAAVAANMLRFCLSLSFIIYEAYYSLGAMATTFWRMVITRRRLLQWVTSTEAEMRRKKTMVDFYRRMFIGPLAALLCLAELREAADAVAVLLTVLWVLSPAAAFLISQAAPARREVLPDDDVLFLKKQARRTWNFFETFVTAGDNWLVPDNFQEEPAIGAAHRTSPTNIGLSLLANLAAYDFGYISMGTLLNRSQKTLNTMGSMPRFKGHFYNWYDTRSLKPLEPLYISSVDSGNLSAHLLVLRSGLLELRSRSIVSPGVFGGLLDTLEVLDEELRKSGAGLEAGERAGLIQASGSLSEIYPLLRRFCSSIPGLAIGRDETAKKWALTLEKQCYEILEDMAFMAPWILLPAEIPGMWEQGDAPHKERLGRLRRELAGLDSMPALGELARLEQKLTPIIDDIIMGSAAGIDTPGAADWFVRLKAAVREASTRSSERINAADYTALLAAEMADVEYNFLLDKSGHFFSIGYNVAERKADSSSYDLLASESRLACFTAISHGRMDQESWFMLGRLLSRQGGDPVLVSWGGSMFEYLMPLLVMPSYEGTLLERTYSAIIGRQTSYGAANNVPWGISESGYNKLDSAMAYQYRSFGVPDAGFKRGLSEDLVVAPYACALALMVEPQKACSNLKRMSASGFSGEYGFYEAVDYTPSRLAPGEERAIVKSFMAHHQGMTFLSYAYALLDRPMQKRFLADPAFKATELLLQERAADNVPFLYDAEAVGPVRNEWERETLLRVYTSPDTAVPETHLLSNGNYSVMVTNSGAGYSRWKDLAVTRWREDAVMDSDGAFVYVRDVESGEFWSTAYQPVPKKPKYYEAVFSRSRAEFKRRDSQIETHMEIAVSPEDDIELRRVRVTNRSRRRRIIELTSYSEVVLNYSAADLAHASFSNLFVETEIIRPYQAIICSRRPRSAGDNFPVMLHLMAVHGKTIQGASYDTDRGKFIGRCNTPAFPDAMRGSGPLSGSEGPVLDPAASIRCTLELLPDETAVVDYVTGICADREAALKLMEKYRDRNLADRVFSLSWTQGQVALQQINATEADAQLYSRLASAIVYSGAVWRSGASVLRRNFRGQPDLWGYGISGDLPLVLVRIQERENIDLITRMVRAHSYWRMNGLAVDLMIWNEDHSVYRNEMGEKINGLIAENSGALSSQPGGIFLRRSDQMSEEDRILMQAVARVVISDMAGTLAEQVGRMTAPVMQRPWFVASKKAAPADGSIAQRTDLEYFNGTGGFTRDGREYVINSGLGKRTPAPWVNVLANKNFGTVISESGGAYTWSENAHEFRLTPWKDDPVTDASGEAVYIRDDETGQFWSPSPLPAAGESGYVSRHGFGYSIFEHRETGIITEMTAFVALEHPVKFAVLKVRNISGHRRSLSAYSYYELVLGDLRDKYHMHIVTEIDPKSGALLAYNHYNKDFPGRVVFLDTNMAARFVSGDRSEFLGRNGSMASPGAMSRDRLSNKTGAGFDPCACMQVKFDLEDNEEKEIIFTFGAAIGADEARAMLQHFSGNMPVRQELENVWEYWKRSLGVVYLETPDNSVNFLVNGWLQYQTIACRMWGRSGYYQSGGAFGFRDQLQDSLSLMNSHPEMVREQLLTSAARQFIEGDVLHWWHPPSGRGVRTRCSDDFLWLAYTTCVYVSTIGDTGVLDERVQYIKGRALKEGEDSYYGLPETSSGAGTLYEHCVAAVKHGLKFGVRGLPLIGGGDWNDGMNLVGKDGKGESVWLAFFLYRTLEMMAGLAAQRGERELSAEWLQEAKKLSGNIEENAWDGRWYVRAYFDSGEVLGSSENSECSIDSLPQSWAVISGASGEERAKAAMSAVEKHLVDRKNSLIKIFDPPFDKCACDPGYIKGYVPGVRENGGQYTHAAAWAIIAFAMLKDKKHAWELFNMINPVMHSDTPGKRDIYMAEPYVMAADVYSGKTNSGRAGWTWYTGSASWMYQLIVEHLVGLKLDVDRLRFEPCLPGEWKQCKLHYRYRETFYHITIRRSGTQDNVLSITVDNSLRRDMSIPLTDDRAEHTAEVVIG
jgi:cellobiose phosphorylase